MELHRYQWISMDYIDAPDARPNNLEAGCSTLPARRQPPQTAMNTTINDHKRKLPVEKFGTLVSRQISPDPKMTWISMDYGYLFVILGSPMVSIDHPWVSMNDSWISMDHPWILFVLLLSCFPARGPTCPAPQTLSPPPPPGLQK